MTDNEWYNREDGLNAMSVIIIASAIVIAVMTLIILGYFVFYKKRINKALKSDGKVKTPTLTPGGTAVTTLVIVWIACTVLTFLMLSSILIHVKNSDIRGVYTYQAASNLYDNQQFYFHSIVDLENKADSQLITNDFKFELGDYHPEDNTISIKVKALPRLVLGKNDKLTFTIGDSGAELKSDKDEYYRCEVRIPTYATETAGILTLETNGTKLTQILSDDDCALNNDFSDEWANYYPFADSSIANEKEENGVLSADVTIVSHTANADKSRRFTELSAVFETDSKTIKTVDLMKDSSVKKNGDSYTYHFSNQVDNNDKAVIIKITGKDELGYSYVIILWSIKDGNYNKSGQDAEPGDEVFCVYDPEGRLVIHSNTNPLNMQW